MDKLIYPAARALCASLKRSSETCFSETGIILNPYGAHETDVSINWANFYEAQ